jgi:hypothetical protein
VLKTGVKPTGKFAMLEAAYNDFVSKLVQRPSAILSAAAND